MSQNSLAIMTLCKKWLIFHWIFFVSIFVKWTNICPFSLCQDRVEEVPGSLLLEIDDQFKKKLDKSYLKVAKKDFIF